MSRSFGVAASAYASGSKPATKPPRWRISYVCVTRLALELHIPGRETLMDYYDFFVTEFTIHDTRALHNDTLHLAYSVSVDGDVIASSLLKLGDQQRYVSH